MRGEKLRRALRMGMEPHAISSPAIAMQRLVMISGNNLFDAGAVHDTLVAKAGAALENRFNRAWQWLTKQIEALHQAGESLKMRFSYKT